MNAAVPGQVSQAKSPHGAKQLDTPHHSTPHRLENSLMPGGLGGTGTETVNKTSNVQIIWQKMDAFDYIKVRDS